MGDIKTEPFSYDVNVTRRDVDVRLGRELTTTPSYLRLVNNKGGDDDTDGKV